IGPHKAVKREIFVHAPAGGAVIDDNLLDGITADVVGTLAAFAHTAANPQVTDNHIAGVDVERGMGQANTVAGGRLAGDGNVGVVDVEVALEVDDSRNPKNNDAWPFGGDCLTETALSTVVEVSDG